MRRPSCGLILAGLLLLGQALNAAELSVEVAPQGDLALAAWWVELETSGNGEPHRWERLAEDGPSVRLALRGQGPWRVRTGAVGVFIEEPPAPVTGPGAIVVRAWRAGAVAGRLQPPRADEWPERVELRLTPAAAPDATGAVVTMCPLRERGELEACPVPAGFWNLRLEAPGYVPAYFWSVEVPAQGARALGTVQLRRGSSIAGRVLTEEGELDSPSARVELRPLLDRNLAPEETKRRLEQLVAVGPVNRWGYFQLTAVPDGLYELTVHHPGYLPATAAPVAVSGTGEHELADPLVLRRPIRATVVIEPARGPEGRPWRVELASRRRGLTGGDLERVARGDADTDGLWRSPPVAPGEYVVIVEGPTGGSFAWKEVEIFRESSTVWVDLPLVEVTGKVLLGGEPLQADLRFTGRFTPESVATRSDEEGELSLVLPRAGSWRVAVTSAEPPVNAPDIEVEIEARGGRAEVTIEVPDTVLAGRVVDRQGKPLGGARVQAAPLREGGRAATVETPEDGEFVLRGLRPGVYGVDARREPLRSRRETVELEEGRPGAPLELVLTGVRSLLGRVESPEGPVPRALVLGSPFGPAGEPLVNTVPHTYTDLEGRFELELPEEASQVRIDIQAPGMVWEVTRLPVPESGEPIVLTLRRGGGALLLEHAAMAGRAGSGDTHVLFQGRELMGVVSTLWSWAAMHGATTAVEDGVLRVPAMSEGPYAWCALAPGELEPALRGHYLPTPSRCRQGFLAEGGELALPLP
jgi:hypothetical protein